MAKNREETLSVWSDDIVFRNVSIRDHYVKRLAKLPAALAKARLMELSRQGGSMRDVFLRQARFLADYEDNFKYTGNSLRYYPVYQYLTDKELRGYFSWRTKVRKGEFPQTAVSFIFIHAYELLNQVGVKDPMDGYAQLCRLNREYGEIERAVPYYIQEWLPDYVAYYGLDPALLDENDQSGHEQAVQVLERVRDEEQATVIDAMKRLFPTWFSRSRFYRDKPADMDAVIFRVLKRMAEHYGAKCKKNIAEQFFGVRESVERCIFGTAVFCDPLKRRNYEYRVNGQCLYKCEDGEWFVMERYGTRKQERKLEGTLKTIDAAMRLEYSYGHPIKAEKQPGWLGGIIAGEIRAHRTQKSARDKIAIDLSQLDKIRADAAITQEKLIVDEEMDPTAQAAAPKVEADKPAVDQPAANPSAGGLSPVEIRFLRALLRGEDLGWLRDEGLMLSVLVDGINEKLYDVFGDSVLDDSPRLVEDYIDDLKEMVEA